jgi:hypothetical protein
MRSVTTTPLDRPLDHHYTRTARSLRKVAAAHVG